METFSEPKGTAMSEENAKGGPATQTSLEMGESLDLDPCQDSQAPLDTSEA